MEIRRSPFGKSTQLPEVPMLACALAWLGLATAAQALPAQIVPLGDEIAVSQRDGDHESGSHIAADRQGGWGATWRSESLDFSHPTGRQRRFDRDGAPVAGSLRDHEFEFADLGLAGDGDGVLVGVRARPELSGAEVDAQCVDALGAPRGARVRVDVGTISSTSRYPLNVRLATASDGTSVVAWQENPRDSAIPPSVFYRRLAADCSPLGNVGSLGAVGVVGRREPHVALRPDDGFVLTFLEGEQLDDLQVAAQQFDASGAALAPSFPVSQSDFRPAFPRVAVGSDGKFAVVWGAYLGTGVAGRVFASAGTALGGELALRLPRPQTTGVVGVAAVGGSFVAAWNETGFVEEGSAVYARVFEAAGPVGDEVSVGRESADTDNVRIVALAGNEFLVAWDDWAEGTLPPDLVARRFLLLPPGTGCTESGTALCLGADRFRIAVEWRDYQGRRGSGHAYPLTSDSGLFWFFADTNLEVLVKVVDACAGFGRHWVYAAATTDVEYTLTATDTATGRSRTYFNPLGRRSPAITDSDAFAICP
ncbi:MAG: hypothetical protein KBI44_02800 [Thermoanaerobaculia bacterium]|jgi:hypothetical protein|nr:hypothetical protein [Thermoanaerobaculia bacterium]